MKASRTTVEKPILMVALGGNALIRKGERGEIEEQFQNLAVPVGQIARLSRFYRIIITHGNGPQVGALLLQQEATADVPRLPLEILVAQTQGQIGYMIESTLDEELSRLGLDEQQYFATLLSYVVVDQDDPAFNNPSKPIGPVFSKEAAAGLPYRTMETAKGFRRVVASPRPVSIVEKREIKKLIDLGFIVISCGGGGIPVVREGRGFHGVEAVIDKDLASATLAGAVGVDVFLIATDVDGVALEFNKPGQRFLKSLTVSDAEKHLAEGQFPPGSMGPKIEAAMQFLEAGGRRAVICSIEAIEEAVAGKAGTEILKSQ